MSTRDKGRDRYRQLIDDYCEGKASIQGDHPKDVQLAIDTFFHAGKMMMDYELDNLPPEYLNNLLTTLNKYPQYRELLMDLVAILKKYEG